MELGGVPNIRWSSVADGIMESDPPLSISGYVMTLLSLPPSREFELRGARSVVCLIRGSVVGDDALLLQKSLLVEQNLPLRAGGEGCLLFVCRDKGDNRRYRDDITGLEIGWSLYDTDMYRTTPQIHVDGYRINLWYLGPNKHGGIHDHSKEPVPFVEFHTQLRGGGWMVKYEDEQGERETERVEMLTGYTHDLFCSTRDGGCTYPWHEYIAGEDGSLFIVFEDTRI